jgi:methyl-accepting chemotaxis protein
VRIISPIFDKTDNLYKIIKFSTDITEQCLKDADYEAQLAATSNSQSVIEFNLDSTVIIANSFVRTTNIYTIKKISYFKIH